MISHPDRGSVNEPSLTIVVVTLVGGTALERCLRAVAKIPGRRLVVARPEHAARAATMWPQFDWRLSTGTVPERRTQAVAAAHSDWVALLEDTCEPAASWQTAVGEIELGTSAAWSGPVQISRDLSPRFMALACTEYWEYTPENWPRLAIGPGPGTAREVTRIPGLNLLYRRTSLTHHDLGAGLVESELHPRLRQCGDTLSMHPGLAVTYFAADANNAALKARYAHGRIYGGGLAMRRSAMSRMAGVVKCLALPVVLSLRSLRGLPPGYRPGLATFGWIVAYCCAWSAGEFLGLVAGRGKSVLAWS